MCALNKSSDKSTQVLKWLLIKTASRNGRSGNLVTAAEQGRFQHVRCCAHMLNLASLPLNPMSELGGAAADVLLHFQTRYRCKHQVHMG